MKQPNPRPESQRSAAAPTGEDAVERTAQRQQRDAEERVDQAIDNQGAQGRQGDAPPAETPPRPPRRR